MSNLEKAQHLCQLVGEGKMLDAIEQYYADNVTVVEGSGETFHGKETQLKRVAEWNNGIQEMHGAGFSAVTANEETGHVILEEWFDVTFKDGDRYKMEEVAVQKWEDGKIVHERFYYNMPGS